MQLKAAMCFGCQHRKQACIIHGVIDYTRELPIRLGAGSVFLDDWPYDLNLIKKSSGCLTRGHAFLPDSIELRLG
jgi:hypothetical protein